MKQLQFIRTIQVAFTCLMFTDVVFSAISISPIFENVEHKAVVYLVTKTFDLKCNVTSDNVKEVNVLWKKDTVPISEVASLKGRHSVSKKGTVSTLSIKEAQESDVGNYTCALQEGDENVEATITAISKSAVKVPTNINVVEGEKLRIHCTVYGNPKAKLTWTYRNETRNESAINSDTDPRVSFENDVENKVDNATLILSDIQMFDRGVYACIGKTDISTIRGETMVRIKDKYAALWPFLGICAEVFVLCAIIFIYEKKRNKTELEESDTDQSPDQKNTPDHNKDSNLRHRQ